MQARTQQGLSKFLLSSNLGPWVVIDFLLGSTLFYLLALLGKTTELAEVRHENFYGAVTLATLFCVAGVGTGFFDRESRLRRFEIIRLGLISWALAIGFGIAALHFLFFMKVGRFALAYGSLGAIAGILGFHLLMSRLLSRYPHRFLILGPLTKCSDELLQYSLYHEQKHYTHSDDVRAWIQNNPSASSTEVATMLREQQILDLVLTFDPKESERNTKIATRALQMGIRVIDEGRFYAELFRRYPIENLSQTWVVTAGFDIQKPITHFLKRLVDLVFSLIALVVLSPFFVLIALLIKATSPGPVFYTQVRQGRYSRPFKVLKFRSMIHQTEHSGSHATSKQDARITFAGKVLRPLHLDELPQLMNILKGEMSFVGPRPEALPIVEKIQAQLPIFEIRHMVRPGLTGIAQINLGKTLDGLEEVTRKLSFDLYYLKNYSLTMDALIVLRTFFVLTKGAW